LRRRKSSRRQKISGIPGKSGARSAVGTGLLPVPCLPRSTLVRYFSRERAKLNPGTRTTANLIAIYRRQPRSRRGESCRMNLYRAPCNQQNHYQHHTNRTFPHTSSFRVGSPSSATTAILFWARGNQRSERANAQGRESRYCGNSIAKRGSSSSPGERI
jgi:hypothetical protein